ncbi:MAG: hypothetical protein AAFX58_10285 [Pseudomonadota bacterium]
MNTDTRKRPIARHAPWLALPLLAAAIVIAPGQARAHDTFDGADVLLGAAIGYAAHERHWRKYRYCRYHDHRYHPRERRYWRKYHRRAHRHTRRHHYRDHYWYDHRPHRHRGKRRHRDYDD